MRGVIRRALVGALLIVAVTACSSDGSSATEPVPDMTGTDLSGQETVATTVPSASTSVAVATSSTSTSAATAMVASPTVIMLTEPDDACVRVSDGPHVDSYPVPGPVDSVETSDGCVLAAVTGGEVMTLSGGGLLPMVDGLPFDRVVSAFFVQESLWLVGRVGDCLELGFLDGDVWQQVADPNGGVTCGDQGGFGPLGVSGGKVVFARYPETMLDAEDFQVELVVYEAGAWTDYGLLSGLPQGAAIDGAGEVWVLLWNGEIARCDTESCTNSNAPGAVTSAQTFGVASGNDGDVWLLGRNALSQFDGQSWTSYTSAPQIEQWGEYLAEDAANVIEVIFVGLDGSPLDPQPDFFGGLGQPFDLDVTVSGDVWLGVRFHAPEGESDSLVHVSEDTWTVHPLDDDNFDVVPEMIAVADQAVWFAHYNTFGDESGNMAEPHIYRYTLPAK